MKRLTRIANGKIYINGEFANYANSTLSYKGRSIVVDYEKILHPYEHIPEGTVPCEIFPYGDGIKVLYIKLDSELEKVNLQSLIEEVEKVLKKESEYL